MKKLTPLLLFGGLAAAQAPPPVTVLAPGASLLGPGTLLDAWVADLDGDGDDDLIAASRFDGGSVYVDVQSWRGAVQTRVVLGAFPRVERVAALDIDLDGDMDVVVGNDDVGVQLLRRDGPGLDQWTLLPLIARRAADKNRFVVTDLDGDGHPDLSIEDLERHVVFARADGLAPQRLTAAEYGAPTLFGDVDGDGDVDFNDIVIIWLSRGEPAGGSSDRRDVDGNGSIATADVDAAAANCSRAGCAVE
ncbi:MAG: VCBS repeat-containing protein [Halioglobus sp.]|nr:VCBS repeat-containing protein [Halioglobus sp.]